MNAIAAAGGGFLLAVLWFDLMFDIQTRTSGGPQLPADVLASISAYYRRVTTQARPMNRLVAAVMLLTLLALAVEVAKQAEPAWIAWPSLLLAIAAIGIALIRTVRNAVRLGAALDPPEAQTAVARAIYRDHQFSFAAMVLMVGLQLAAAF